MAVLVSLYQLTWHRFKNQRIQTWQLYTAISVYVHLQASLFKYLKQLVSPRQVDQLPIKLNMGQNEVDASAEMQGMDSGEKRLNELGYKQELRREMTLFKTLAISFSTMTLFTGITPLYGSSLAYGGPATLVWGWVVVSFFTWFVGLAMAEICSSFPVRPFLIAYNFFENNAT